MNLDALITGEIKENGRSVAVVGNGPILGDQGTVIDRHEVVFRFNNLKSLTNSHGGSRLTHLIFNRKLNPNRQTLDLAQQHQVKVATTYAPGDAYAVLLGKSLHANGLALFFSQMALRSETVERLRREKVPRGQKPRPRVGFALIGLLHHIGVECNVFGTTDDGDFLRGEHYPKLEFKILQETTSAVIVPVTNNPGDEDWPILKYGIENSVRQPKSIDADEGPGTRI